RYVSPLYLRVEDIPEYADLPPADRQRIAHVAAPLRARNATPDLIDRDSVWEAKRAALQIIYSRPLSPARDALFERFRVAEGRGLTDWATWCALAETHGPDWRAWPAPLRDARSPTVEAERRRLAEVSRFHAWVQWLADEQRCAAQSAARAAGM